MSVHNDLAPCPKAPNATLKGRLNAQQRLAQCGTHESGWQQDFAALLEQHRSWILSRCRAQLGNHCDAQDVAQEVMLRAFRALARFEGRGSLRSWLCAIADNQCRTFAVRRAKYTSLEYIEPLIALYEHNHTWQDLDERQDEHAQVAKALAKSPASVREILYLRFFQDCSFAEIASRLEISLSAAKMRLYRALAQFKCAYDVGTG